MLADTDAAIDDAVAVVAAAVSGHQNDHSIAIYSTDLVAMTLTEASETMNFENVTPAVAAAVAAAVFSPRIASSRHSLQYHERGRNQERMRFYCLLRPSSDVMNYQYHFFSVDLASYFLCCCYRY